MFLVATGLVVAVRLLGLMGTGLRKLRPSSWHSCGPSSHQLEEVLSSGLSLAGSCLSSSNWIFLAVLSLVAYPSAGSFLMRVWCQGLDSSSLLGCSRSGPGSCNGQLPSPTWARIPGAACLASDFTFPQPFRTVPTPVRLTNLPLFIEVFIISKKNQSCKGKDPWISVSSVKALTEG